VRLLRNRWLQLAVMVLATVALSNMQYGWTLRSGSARAARLGFGFEIEEREETAEIRGAGSLCVELHSAGGQKG